jgi:DNA-binding CsgD family transcriptional regulator
MEVDTIELLAGVAADLDSYQEAGRLLGAAAARRNAIGYARATIMQHHRRADLSAVQTALGDERTETAITEGARMSWDDALRYATRGRGKRQRPSTGWASLTPAELAVVTLIPEGLTHRQIAERLFIAPRTVGTHLTHVFTKLGLTSRAELIAETRRRNP